MFELTTEATFSAAHQVKGYPGDCAGVHGHTYRVTARVKVEKLDKLGMATDFRFLRQELNTVVQHLDHKNLNALPFFKKHNATAEWIAVFIYKQLKKKNKKVASVTVWEGTENAATYYET
jgi:6-pyruvoyltetrahydropterin/6-carboxytetrahydropterin synthase